MSYVQSSNFYSNNPRPYLTSDSGAPVPGWGSNPQIAGPPRVAMGDAPAVCPPGTRFDPSKSLCVRAVAKAALTRKPVVQQCWAAGHQSRAALDACVAAGGPTAGAPSLEVGGGIVGALGSLPWWAMLGGAVVIGGGIAYVVSR